MAASTILSKLSVIPLKAKPAGISNVNPTEKRREKLIDKLKEQAALAKAMAAGDRYIVHKTVKTKNEDGTKTETQKEVKVSPWWWQDPTSKGLVMVCRYGVKPLPLSKGGMKALSVPNLKAVPSVIEQLIQATAAGELDDALANAAIREVKSK